MRTTLRLTLAALLTLAATATLAQADTYTFTGTGNWSDPTNWLNGVVPPNDPDTQILITSNGRNISTNVDSARYPWILNSLTLQTPTTLYADSPDSFTTDFPNTYLSFTGTNPFIALTGPYPMTVSGLFESDAPLTISNTSNGAFTFSANIIAPQVVLTAGSIHFTVPNTLPNGITVSPGTGFVNLTIDDAESLGDGPLTYNFTSPQQSSILTLPTSANSFANALIINTPLTGNDGVYFLSPNSGSVATWAFPSLTVNGNAGIETQQQGIVSITSVSITGSLAVVGSFNLSNISGTGSLSANFGTLTLNTANTYLGGTTALSTGSIIANVAGALSTGPIALTSRSQLFLNATAAANADVTVAPGDTSGGSIFYNANAAANGHHLTANSIVLSPSITSLGGDAFTITTNGSLTGDADTFPLLIRGGNLTLSPGATLIATDAAVPAVQNLGSAADLFFGFTDYHAINVTVGTGTPWAGVSGTFAGTITANSDFTLASVYFFANVAASSPVHVTITGQSDFSRSLANLSGVSQFTVANGATLAFESDHVLGGGSNTAPAALDVAAGATLAFEDFSSAALNGPVTIHTGSTVNFTYQFFGGLTGSGAISRDSGPITFIISSPDAFAGPQLTPAFTQPGDTIYLEADDIQNLQSLNPAATYIAPFSVHSQSNDLVLNGGMLLFQIQGPSSVGSLSGAGTLRIGDEGETILAVNSPTWRFGKTEVSTIANPVIATGPLTIRSTDPAANSNVALFLSGNNSLQNVAIQYASFGADSPASLTNASLSLDHAYLFLNAAPVSPDTTATYNNTITVSGESTLDDHAILFGNVTPSPSVPRLTIGTVNLAAPLHLYIGSSTFHITNLHVTADTSLISHTGNHIITLDTLSQDTAHTLTLQGAAGVTGAAFHASALSAFNGTIVIDNAALTLAAPEDPASSPTFAVNAGAALDIATSYNFSRPTDPTLTGAGLVIIDPGVVLALPIDSAFSGTIEVNGTLLITAPRDPNSIITTPNFTVINNVPEPASLALLALAAPTLLTRRRRTSH